MSPSFWQYHPNIEKNVTNNSHFAFVYLLGKLAYSLYGHKNPLYMNVWNVTAFSEQFPARFHRPRIEAQLDVREGIPRYCWALPPFSNLKRWLFCVLVPTC